METLTSHNSNRYEMIFFCSYLDKYNAGETVVVEKKEFNSLKMFKILFI